MTSTKNIIMMTSLAAVLGFGIVAIQNYNVSADSLIDNSSKILGFGDNVEITTLSHTPGHKGPLKADETFGDNRLKCSLGSVLKCTVLNSNGLDKVTLSKIGSEFECDVNDVKDGVKRAPVDTRRNLDPDNCNYVPFNTYRIDVETSTTGTHCFLITSDSDSMTVAPTDCPAPA